jgi:hypothetical protein
MAKPNHPTGVDWNGMVVKGMVVNERERVRIEQAFDSMV